MHIHILLINPLIPHREILFTLFRVASSIINFNPLIPHREIQQYCTKICYHILAILPKIHLFFLSAAPKTLKIPRTNSKNDSYSSANPPHFSCELPVRTKMTFAIHNHLPHSYHITSFIDDTFTIPKKILIRSSQSTVLCDSYDLFIK